MVLALKPYVVIDYKQNMLTISAILIIIFSYLFPTATLYWCRTIRRYLEERKQKRIDAIKYEEHSTLQKMRNLITRVDIRPDTKEYLLDILDQYEQIKV